MGNYRISQITSRTFSIIFRPLHSKECLNLEKVQKYRSEKWGVVYIQERFIIGEIGYHENYIHPPPPRQLFFESSCHKKKEELSQDVRKLIRNSLIEKHSFHSFIRERSV